MYNCKLIKTNCFRLYKNERPHPPRGAKSPPDKTSISLKQAISGPRFTKLKKGGNPCLGKQVRQTKKTVMHEARPLYYKLQGDCFTHMLNMELDLLSFIWLLCTAVLIGQDPATPPVPLHFGLTYYGTIGQPRY
jgi:hypothetical protein